MPHGGNRAQAGKRAPVRRLGRAPFHRISLERDSRSPILSTGRPRRASAERCCDAIEATRRVVSTNTNLGIVLLLAPLAAVADGADLADGVEAVLAATTVEDARDVYRAIRLAQPGGLGDVADQDVAREPTMSLRAVMGLAAERDSIARQYANGFQQIFGEALPALRASLDAGLSTRNRDHLLLS